MANKPTWRETRIALERNRERQAKLAAIAREAELRESREARQERIDAVLSEPMVDTEYAAQLEAGIIAKRVDIRTIERDAAQRGTVGDSLNRNPAEFPWIESGKRRTFGELAQSIPTHAIDPEAPQSELVPLRALVAEIESEARQVWEVAVEIFRTAPKPSTRNYQLVWVDQYGYDPCDATIAPITRSAQVPQPAFVQREPISNAPLPCDINCEPLAFADHVERLKFRLRFADYACMMLDYMLNSKQAQQARPASQPINPFGYVSAKSGQWVNQRYSAVCLPFAAEPIIVFRGKV